MRDELKQSLASLRQVDLPFHPIILVFATGDVSNDECLPMQRSPMPKVGVPFDAALIHNLREAFELNPSIHDGAIIFSRYNKSDPYHLSSWSMRIVSKHISQYSEPNLGSAYNSALSLSMANNIDICCIISSNRTTFFQKGRSFIEDGFL